MLSSKRLNVSTAFENLNVSSVIAIISDSFHYLGSRRGSSESVASQAVNCLNVECDSTSSYIKLSDTHHT